MKQIDFLIFINILATRYRNFDIKILLSDSTVRVTVCRTKKNVCRTHVTVNKILKDNFKFEFLL